MFRTENIPPFNLNEHPKHTHVNSRFQTTYMRVSFGKVWNSPDFRLTIDVPLRYLKKMQTSYYGIRYDFTLKLYDKMSNIFQCTRHGSKI